MDLGKGLRVVELADLQPPALEGPGDRKTLWEVFYGRIKAVALHMTMHPSSVPCLPESYDTYRQYVRRVC